MAILINCFDRLLCLEHPTTWASKAHLEQNAVTKYIKVKLFPDKLSLCHCIHQQNLSTEANWDAEHERLHREKKITSSINARIQNAGLLYLFCKTIKTQINLLKYKHVDLNLPSVSVEH